MVLCVGDLEDSAALALFLACDYFYFVATHDLPHLNGLWILLLDASRGRYLRRCSKDYAMSDCVDRSGQIVLKYIRLNTFDYMSNTKEEKSNEEE